MASPHCPARRVLPQLDCQDCGRCPLLRVRADKGKLLPRLLEESGSLSFVERGLVMRARHLPDAAPVVFDVVPAGEAFGGARDSSEGQRWPDDHRAIADTQVCFASRDTLQDLLQKDPSSATRLLHVYERTADRVAEWSMVRAIPGARDRLDHTLRLLGGERPEWATLGLLSSLSGLRRETVCRALRMPPGAGSSRPGTGPSAADLRPTA